MIMMLSVHPSRNTALLTSDLMRTDPSVPAKEYMDGFGNICHVIHAPAGNISLSSDFLIHDSGIADEVAPDAQQLSMENLPVDTLAYLLGSRYCETDRFVEFAWSQFGAHEERRGVCRDFAHLAITLCRCMNIPARYCTGYLGDIGVPPDPAPMDFSAWFEVFLGDRWYTFDARHNVPRIGRILMARGRDATDVAISTSFGPCQLTGFKVFTDEVDSAA
jgi:transglutaminase-like putative cysteine protease